MDITEKKFLAFAASSLLADGGQYGELQFLGACNLRVGQKIHLKSSTQPSILVKVNRVLSDTEILVGKDDKPISDRIDVSAYLLADSASVFANEQGRPHISPDDAIRGAFAEEPALAFRNILVDKLGQYIGQDSTNPFHVRLSDGSVNIGTVNAELEVQLSHQDDVPNAGDVADSVQIGDGVEILQINPDGSITVRFGGVTGTLLIHREANTITDTTEKTVATLVVTQNNTSIINIKGDAQTLGTWRMYKNSVAPANLLNVTKTSHEERNGIMKLEQPEIFANGESMLITFQPERYRSEFLGASSTTFVKVEGFVS